MKKVTILAVAMLSLTASLAMAQINLYVNDCGAGSSTSTVTNACTLNTGTAFVAYASLIMPAVTRVGFVGCVGVLDVQTTDAGQINDWWRGDAGSCRATGFSVAADGAIGGSCATLWDNVPPAGSNLTSLYGVAESPANRTRFLLGVVLASTDAYDLTGDGATEMSVFKFTVLRAKTLGATACVGCATPACLVLNEINMQTLTDSPETFLRLVTPASNNHINYNSFTGAVCPDAVPVRNRTWGSVKALYR
jgi:hypothetical protein